jgi:hypothetical protein
MFAKLVVSCAIVVSLPAFALAQSGPLQGSPCMSDVKTLCGAIQPGGGRIRDCMQEHRAQLSIACKVTIADRMLERRGRTSGNSATIRTVPTTDDALTGGGK